MVGEHFRDDFYSTSLSTQHSFLPLQKFKWDFIQMQGLHLSFSSSWLFRNLPRLKYVLFNSTDDPSVISDSLAQYGNLVYVDKSSVLHNIRPNIYESRSSLQDIYAAACMVMKHGNNIYCSTLDLAFLNATNKSAAKECNLRTQLFLQVFCHSRSSNGISSRCRGFIYLSRLPGYLGEFLALTKEKLNGAEFVACGIANHYSLSGVCTFNIQFFTFINSHDDLFIHFYFYRNLPRLKYVLFNSTDDPSVISDSLAQYGNLVYVDKSSVLHNIRPNIYESRSSLQDIYAAACMVERSGWTTNVNTLMGMRQKFALGIMPIPIPLILQTNLGYEAWEQYILLNSGSCFFKCNKQVCSQRM
ncbi:hypothetical protein L2E82_25023 [Cichorium intybus]|uniref:Uncharacterized protein n=1 Tax=Cichorium intybus TaxID=13427 RepID=A0ACB9E2R5_CICIN|nr:hypothetical protein L2E82_25023 [Cichorium intybus]